MQKNADGSITISGPNSAVAGAFELSAQMTWERFCTLMTQADELLGGGSDFSETWLSHRFGQIPVTYEEALADYKLCVSVDRLSGTHARLFSDYAGFILGLLPVFPAVFLFLRDRKSISSLLYTRRISSVQFVATRYAALVTAVMIPILLMGAILTVLHAGDYGLQHIDPLAYLKHSLFWLLPTAMVSTAVGVFFTVLTNTPAAIGVQLVWWFVDTMGGSSGPYSYFGARPLQLIPRHNRLGGVQLYLDNLSDLIQNRIIIAVFALLLVALSAFAFSAKRRGLLRVPFIQRSKV